MKRMQATRINPDVKAINKNPRLSAFENPRHPRAILFWNADEMDASNTDERRF